MSNCSDVTDSTLGILSKSQNVNYSALEILRNSHLVKYIKYLDLKMCNKITDDCIKHIKKLNKLIHLDLSYCYRITNDKVNELSIKHIERMEQNLDPNIRYFKIKTGNELIGRFTGRKPKQAAFKVLTSIMRSRMKKNISTTNPVKFSIVEYNKDKIKREFNFIGTRTELAEPVKINICNKNNPQIVTFRYTNHVSRNYQK